MTDRRRIHTTPPGDPGVSGDVLASVCADRVVALEAASEALDPTSYLGCLMMQIAAAYGQFAEARRGQPVTTFDDLRDWYGHRGIESAGAGLVGFDISDALFPQSWAVFR